MISRCLLAVTAIVLTSTVSSAQQASSNGVRTLGPPGLFRVEGAWSLGARAGDFVFLSGMPGIDPATNRIVGDPEEQVRQAFLNIRRIAESEGATLRDCVKLTVYLSDLNRFAAIVDKVESELWTSPPYPPRTLIEVQRLFDGMIVEIDSVFYTPVKK
jgi:enamine deaminase RidA (YjgF/YER057c/UK114 family)